MEFIQEFLDNINPWYAVITSVIGTFATIATMTPNETDNKIVDALYKLINLLGMNKGKAADKD